MELIKREWCFSQSPEVYEVFCNICNGRNTTWSEYKEHIWCFDCKKDVQGTKGIFDGPIPMGLCGLMGIRFDRIRLSDNKLQKPELVNGKYVYK